MAKTNNSRDDRSNSLTTLPDISFKPMKQGILTNNFSKATGRATLEVIDKMTGQTTFKVQPDMYEITLPTGYPSARMRDSLYNLMDMLLEAYTAHGADDETVTITIQQYMADCGLTSRDRTRDTMKQDLQTLRVSAIRFKEMRRGKAIGGYLDVNIVRWSGMDKKGNVTVAFTPEAHAILKDYPVMPYPKQIRRIDGRRNPNSRAFLKAFAEHRRINAGRPVQDTLSVQSLLAVSKLPLYANVMASKGHVTQQIIKPFERDMDALQGVLTWQYCHQGGAALTDDELEHFDYNVFTRCNVQVKWLYYPDQAHLIQARVVQAAKRKKRTIKPQAETGVGTTST